MNLWLCFVCQCQGGNSVNQRVRRFIYDVKVTLTVSPAIVSLPWFLSRWPDLSPSSVCPSSRCSARLRCWAASWSASRLPSPPSSATSAVEHDPLWVTMTTTLRCWLRHCSVAKSWLTKSPTDDENHEEDLRLNVDPENFTVHHNMT